jgi:ribosome maturation factor RimP
MGRRPIFRLRATRGDGSMLRDRLTSLLRPVVEGLGYELWELECAPGRAGGFVRLYIDAEAGITLEDCERVSRAVSEVLDEADPVAGQYTLEVSSPGADRPLRTAAHFARFAGAVVFVELVQPVDGRRRYKGRLVAAGAEAVEVEVDGRRYALPIAGIRKAHVVP